MSDTELIDALGKLERSRHAIAGLWHDGLNWWWLHRAKREGWAPSGSFREAMRLLLEQELSR